jgi:hypothetical protein
VRRVLLALTLAFLCATPLETASAQATSLVTIVHGLPRFVADIYVNGDLLLDGFRPQDVTEPLELPADDYHIEIRDVGASPASDPVLEETLSLGPGLNVSIIAHLTPEGTPALSVFSNRVSRVPAGKARLQIRHGANAPAVDVVVEGHRRLTDVTGDQDREVILPAGRHSLTVRSATGNRLLLRGQNVNLEEGTAIFVYLIGSADERTLDLMVQRLRGVGSPPSGVPTGDGGQAARNPVSPEMVGLLVIGSLTLALLFLVPRQRSTGSL